MFSKTKRLEEILNPEHAGLLIIDLQNDYLADDGMTAKIAPRGQRRMKKIVPGINELHDLFKERGLPVIWTQDFEDVQYRSVADMDRFVWLEDGKKSHIMCLTNTKGAEFIKEPDKHDVVVPKHHASAYIGTDLAELIAKHGIKTLYVTGLKTNRCVMLTVQDLHDHEKDLHVVPVEDCIASDDLWLHRACLKELKKFYPPVVKRRTIMRYWRKLDKKSR